MARQKKVTGAAKAPGGKASQIISNVWCIPACSRSPLRVCR